MRPVRCSAMPRRVTSTSGSSGMREPCFAVGVEAALLRLVQGHKYT
jgi:hypothetical protein